MCVIKFYWYHCQVLSLLLLWFCRQITLAVFGLDNAGKSAFIKVLKQGINLPQCYFVWRSKTQNSDSCKRVSVS